MKKMMALVLVMVCVLTLVSCGKNNTYKIKIIVPAGSTEAFVYSDEEISATSNKITISSGEGLSDTEVILLPVNEMVETGYVATYLTPGMPVEFDGEKGEWFKIGVSIQNPTDTDKIVYVEVEGVEVRIISKEMPDTTKVPASLAVTTTDSKYGEFGEYLSKYELAAYLGITDDDVTSLINSGELKEVSTKLGANYVFVQDAVDEWMAERLAQ